jgi:hypothetical protein
MGTPPLQMAAEDRLMWMDEPSLRRRISSSPERSSRPEPAPGAAEFLLLVVVHDRQGFAQDLLGRQPKMRSAEAFQDSTRQSVPTL